MKKFTTFLILILLVAALVWWRQHIESDSIAHPGSFAPPSELIPFRTAGGTLHTNGFLKTETLHNETGSWLGTTSSTNRLNATYRYDIELRSNDWNISIDDGRKVAFVVAPSLRPQLPVAIESRRVAEWRQSGWGRFDKWEQLRALRQEISPHLEKLAESRGYVEVARGQARLTVEEFVADWLLKQRGWPRGSQRFVKVYFADEPDIPFPDNKTLKDFLP